MRRIVLIPLLLLTVALAACDSVTSPRNRTVDGQWSARIDGEQVWVTLRDDGGRISGSGDWGIDRVYVVGERFGDDLNLIFEFSYFNPVELDGRIRGSEIDGRLQGSGYRGERVVFRRDSRW